MTIRKEPPAETRPREVLPPGRGISLGWRLALSASLFVSLLMAAVTAVQRVREIDSERTLREALLKKALAPLVVSLESAGSVGEIEARLAEFHHAYLKAGFPDHQVRIRDARGKIVASTLSGPVPDAEASFRASLPFVSAALGSELAEIAVWEGASGFNAQVSRQWLSWVIHVGVTVVGILLVILTGVHLLVGRPLRQLMEGLRRMEMGYWGEVAMPGGSWEFSWLAWRFGNLGNELNATVGQLVAAERRAVASNDAGRRSPLHRSPEEERVSKPAYMRAGRGGLRLRGADPVSGHAPEGGTRRGRPLALQAGVLRARRVTEPRGCAPRGFAREGGMDMIPTKGILVVLAGVVVTLAGCGTMRWSGHPRTLTKSQRPGDSGETGVRPGPLPLGFGLQLHPDKPVDLDKVRRSAGSAQEQ